MKTIVTRTSEPSETHDVDYILAEPRPGTFAIVDIVTDGASLTTGYRNQLTKMLQTPGQGYAYLVQSLQSRVTPTPLSATSLPSKPRLTIP